MTELMCGGRWPGEITEEEASAALQSASLLLQNLDYAKSIPDETEREFALWQIDLDIKSTDRITRDKYNELNNG